LTSEGEGDTAVDEWKSSISQIDKFDGYLIDLRKYGFSFITGLATAGSFLGFQQSAHNIHIGVIIATMVLVDILFWVDQYYQNLLYGALFNARRLEALTGRHLVGYISDENRIGNLKRSFQIAIIYIGFLIALWVLGSISAQGAASQPACPNQCVRPSVTPAIGELLTERNSFIQIQDEQIVPNFSTLRLTLLEVMLVISLVATVGYIMTLQIKVAKRRRENYENGRAQLRDFESRLQDKKLEVQKLEEQKSTLLRRQQSMSYPFFRVTAKMEDKIDFNR
jgi:hypothetical protein